MAVTGIDRDLTQLYADLQAGGLIPLWTARDDLMPMHPQPRAVAHLWRWADVYALARRAGDLVPVGRGGERRAIALANPGLGGEPFATPTLWAALQYLGPDEVAPEHRHSQNAFRFVLEGEGVWTVVDGDPVAMRRGDLLLTGGGRFHGHHNATDQPMAWLDGLDIPLQSTLDTTFFQFGEDGVQDRSTPARSRSEMLWGHPGLRPVGAHSDGTSSPLAAYRWRDTDAALADQLEVAASARVPGLTAGHAEVRFVNPETGGDVLNTMRLAMHRVVGGAVAEVVQEVGSSVWQVFEGAATVAIGTGSNLVRHEVERGDVFVVPSWSPVRIDATSDLDLFVFSDAPVIEKLGLHRPSFGLGT
jgi:gentisate 1,2-dioxygenase